MCGCAVPKARRRWCAATPRPATAPNPGTASGAWPRGSRRQLQGLDIRYVVTNITRGSAEWLYDSLYCARGQAENLIKLHKSQLASDRTSCRSPLANQVRLMLHTAAYWLMLTLRDAIPKPQPLASAEFTTLRLRLIKIAARITETATPGAHRLRRRLPRGCAVPRHRALAPTGRTVTAGACAPNRPISSTPTPD